MESVSEFGKCGWNYIFHNVFCSFCCLALLLFMAPRVTWKYIFLISPGLLTCLFSSGFQTMLEGWCQGQWIKISLVKKSTLGSRERYGEAGCAWSSVRSDFWPKWAHYVLSTILLSSCSQGQCHLYRSPSHLAQCLTHKIYWMNECMNEWMIDRMNQRTPVHEQLCLESLSEEGPGRISASVLWAF